MATHPRTFQPKALADREPIVGYSIISGNYFKVADDLRALSRTGRDDRPGHYYVFPALVMYVAAFEAFIQENLAFSRFSAAQSPTSHDEELTHLDALKNQSSPYQEFKVWVKEVYRLYDRTGRGIDTSGPEYQDLLALKELRNSVVHYNPLFIEVAFWPARLEQALHRTKIDVLNAGWVTNFSNNAVADWARETIKANVQLFCRLSGARDPFLVVLERDGMIPWE